MILDVIVPLEAVNVDFLNELLENRGGLIEKMVKTSRLNAKISYEDAILRVYWAVNDELTADKATIYKVFIKDLCLYSGRRKNMRYNNVAIDNEKCAARSLLLTMGYRGRQYHSARLALLDGLEGTTNPYYVKQ